LKTLQEILAQEQVRGVDVFEPGFSQLYVRWGWRVIDGKPVSSVLTIAAVTAECPGRGTFTRLLNRLYRDGIHIQVDGVGDQLKKRLVTMGFLPVGDHALDSFHRPPKK
jgi:hypothetical protein